MLQTEEMLLFKMAGVDITTIAQPQIFMAIHRPVIETDPPQEHTKMPNTAHCVLDKLIMPLMAVTV